MILSVDTRAPVLRVTLGFRDSGLGPLADVTLHDAGFLVLAGKFDFPSSWPFHIVGEYLGKLLDLQCQGELPDMGGNVQVWEHAASYLV